MGFFSELSILGPEKRPLGPFGTPRFCLPLPTGPNPPLNPYPPAKTHRDLEKHSFSPLFRPCFLTFLRFFLEVGNPPLPAP